MTIETPQGHEKTLASPDELVKTEIADLPWLFSLFTSPFRVLLFLVVKDFPAFHA